MATTFIPFQPTSSAPFQFQATFDGAVYTLIVTWNFFGQRYYVNCYDLTNTRIFTLPLIGSPVDKDISITAGYFTTKLVFRQRSQVFEVIS